MPRTLSVNADAWRLGTGWIYDWLVESEDLGIRWSFTTDSAGGHTFEQRLHSISEIELSVPPGGGLASANTVTIQTYETGAGLSLRALWDLHGRMEGADLAVSLLPSPGTYADKITVFSGRIDYVAWGAGVASGEGLGTLIAVDDTLHHDILVPSTVLTVETYPNLPEPWQAAILPLIYGSSDLLIAAPLLMIDSATFTYLVADHGLGSMFTTHAVALAEGSRFNAIDAAGTTADAATATLILPQPVTEHRYFIADQTPAISQSLNVTNASNIIDDNVATLAVIGTGTVNGDGDGWGRLAVTYTWLEPEGANTLFVAIANHRRSVGAAATVTAELVVRVVDATTATVLRDNLFRDGPYRHQSNPRSREVIVTPFAVSAPSGVEVEIEVLNEGGAGAAGDTWAAAELVCVLYFQADTLFHPIYLFAPWEGRADPDGAFTGSIGTTIRQAASVVQSVLVQRLGLSIDTASFTAAKTDLVTYLSGQYRFDFGLGSGGWYRPQMAAAELLDTLAQQAGCYLFPSGTGTIKLAIAQGQTTSQLSLTVSNTSSVRVELSRLELVHSTIEVRYAWSVTLGRFTQVALATPGGCNHPDSQIAVDLLNQVIDANDRYGPLAPLVLEAYAIQDPSTAFTRLQSLVAYHWTQQVVVTCETTFVGIHLEVGDLVDITHPELPANLNGSLFEIVRLTHVPEQADSRPWPIRLVCLAIGMLTSFDYFLIKDQDNVTWYWWVNRAGELTWGATPPSIATRIAEDLALSPTPSWLELTNPTPAARYVYPIPGTGEPVVATSAPALGTGYVGTPLVRSMGVGTWGLDVSAAEEVLTVEV